jgi:hypothetical protein
LRLRRAAPIAGPKFVKRASKVLSWASPCGGLGEAEIVFADGFLQEGAFRYASQIRG